MQGYDADKRFRDAAPQAWGGSEAANPNPPQSDGKGGINLSRYFTSAMYLRYERLPALAGDLDSEGGSNEILLSRIRNLQRTNITLANGGNNNVSIGEDSFQKIEGPSAVFSITGITGGREGRLLILLNSVAFAMTLTNESGSSTAANRILTLTGGDVTLRAGTSAAVLLYDDEASRWILIATN